MYVQNVNYFDVILFCIDLNFVVKLYFKLILMQA